MSNPSSGHDYVLGTAENEQRRLALQASILRGWTEMFCRSAGLRPGMRVLDVGCGMGDVAVLAAEMVGPSGSVIAIDREAGTIEKARARAAQSPSRAPVQFEHADIGTYAAATQFDAVVGRYILLYQPDPVAAIRKLATLVRSASRLEAEAVSLGCQLAGPVQVGAWVTLA